MNVNKIYKKPPLWLIKQGAAILIFFNLWLKTSCIEQNNKALLFERVCRKDGRHKKKNNEIISARSDHWCQQARSAA